MDFNSEIVMNKHLDFNDQKIFWEKEKIVIYLRVGDYSTGNLNYL